MKYDYVKDVICPFFITQHISSARTDPDEKSKLITKMNKSIKCEGPCKNSSVILEFSDERARAEHKHNFCASFCYNTCPIAIMIGKTKYEEK